MNGQVDEIVEESMETASEPDSVASHAESSHDEPSQEKTDSIIEEHLELSNHSESSNGSEVAPAKHADNLSDHNEDSSSQSISESSHTKKKDSSEADSDDGPKMNTVQAEESESEGDSDDSSDDNSEEGNEDTVSVRSETASEGPTDNDKSRKTEILMVDELSNHDEAQSKASLGEDASPRSEIHEITGSDNDNDDLIITTDKTEQTMKESKGNSEIKPKEDPVEVTPRRSSRAIKRKRYDDTDGVVLEDRSAEVQHVAAEDPLRQRSFKAKPVFVNGTKKSVDLTVKQSPKPPISIMATQRKEPSLVIIDTNSILSGKGPIQFQPKPQSLLQSSLSQQSLYRSIAARGTTVTPVPAVKPVPVAHSTPSAPQPNPQLSVNTNILPSLTDDMFVVEAPSFIVPYVYEKPSVKPFREFVDSMGKEIEDLRKKELKEKKDDKPKPVTEETKDGNNVIAEALGLTKSAKHDIKGKKHDKKDRKRGNDDDDISWDGESSTESEDDASDEDHPKTIIIKDKEEDSVIVIKDNSMALAPLSSDRPVEGKSDSFFDNSLGKFFLSVGISLVEEYVQNDLLKQQKRKLYKENRLGSDHAKATEASIASLTANLNFSRDNNAPYKFPQKKCQFCSFKTESVLVMAHHMETPHMKNSIYKCNFCDVEIKSPHDILFHMEIEHKIRGRLERAPAFHPCVNCPFEDNSKTKLARHLIACTKKFKPETNLAPPLEWEPPAKIPKIMKVRNNVVNNYQAAFVRSQGIRPQLNIGGTTIMGPSGSMMTQSGAMSMMRGRGRPQAPLNQMATIRNVTPMQAQVLAASRNALLGRPPSLLPQNYNLTGTSLKAVPKASQQPSISITPLPRATQPSTPSASAPTPQAGKGTFVICEICDGYIKDLEQLRNHMQWIHKVKIHPKMIYNRPPLNCQKCQFRFFSDQGLERHLLGSHGLVTSSMQEAANKGKDAGRCPVCGRVYQWKLLNHVARDHNMTLKPAHLSYKCTVCTATFGMYKQFENHVYSAHSVVAKRVDKNKGGSSSGLSSAPKSGDSMLKPLRINDEITIIPQPPKVAASPVLKPSA